MIDQLTFNVVKVTIPGRVEYERARAVITGDGEEGPGAVLEVQDRRFHTLESIPGRAFPDGTGGYVFFPDGATGEGEAVKVERMKNCGCGGISTRSLEGS